MLSVLLISAALLGAQDAGVAATAPAAKPVTVNAYKGNYEGQDTAAASRLDNSILSAFAARQSEAGPMEGTWIIADAEGHRLVSLELRNAGGPGQLDGAWRAIPAGYGLNSSGLLSDLTVTGRDMEINYFVGHARSPVVLELHKGGDDQWRGAMLDPSGKKTAVLMSRAHNQS